MINRIIILIYLALAASAANAQIITDELRRVQSGQGTIIINQSEAIDRLVNNQPAQVQTTTTAAEQKNQPVVPVVVERKETTTPATAERKDTPAETPATEPSAATANRPTPSSSQTSTETDGVTVNTNKKIMRHSYKTTGYRIQVYSGGNKREDRQKCEQISARLKTRFPNLPIYVHFYSPSWKCRAGNFTDMGEAKSVLKQIRAMGYSQACLVKGTINVQY